MIFGVILIILLVVAQFYIIQSIIIIKNDWDSSKDCLKGRRSTCHAGWWFAKDKQNSFDILMNV